MWHQFWIPILIPTLIIKSNCDVNKTESDVVFHYAGHAEADYSPEPKTTTTINKIPETSTNTAPVIATTVKTYIKPTTTKEYDEVRDDVMFVPNNKEVDRKEEEEYDTSHNFRIKDIMMMKTVNDALDPNFRKQGDSPNEDIVFISGKNHDVTEKAKAEESARRSDRFNRVDVGIEDEFITQPTLNCNDLDCNNTIKSVCGAKVLNHEWKYRMFLNDCYYRKVNCGLKYEINRYKQVPVEKCKSIGGHYIERPFSFKAKPFNNFLDKPLEKENYSARRSSLSRRSMTMNYNGQFCSHACPVSCPDDYEPQCAISGTGQRRVFLNHCKLDHNSCFYGVVWHKRPLAECVGGKKADMRQNRGFIGWMQRVGIVDNRGRLVLE